MFEAGMLRPEQQLQQQVAGFIRKAYPGLLWWHTPNQSGRRDAARLGKILKSMGVLAGVPDLTIILPTGHAAFIELKAGKGKLTEGQEAFRDKCQSVGCFWAEARSLEEVAEALHRWLHPLGWTSRARI